MVNDEMSDELRCGAVSASNQAVVLAFQGLVKSEAELNEKSRKGIKAYNSGISGQSPNRPERAPFKVVSKPMEQTR